MEYIKVTEKYYEHTNHYRGTRTPPWIKLHYSLLDDYNFTKLPDSEKYFFIAIMMLASRSHNKIAHDIDWITHKIGACVNLRISALIDAGFIEVIHDDSESVSEDALKFTQDASKSLGLRDKKRKEKKNIKKKFFDEFYAVYPRKRDPDRAWRAWKKINPDESLREKIMVGVKNLNKEIQIKNKDKEFVKYPASWLNGYCWDDEPELTVLKTKNAEPMPWVGGI